MLDSLSIRSVLVDQSEEIRKMMKEQKDKIQTVNVRNQYLAAIVGMYQSKKKCEKMMNEVFNIKYSCS